jgi:hypothetical protein
MSRACSSHHDSSDPRGASASPLAPVTAGRARRGRRRAALVALAAALAVLGGWGAAAASADEASTIIERCTHGQSLAGFSRGAYAKALRELPTDVSEYSDCEERIRKAALAAAGGAGPGAGGGAVPPPTPAEQAVLASAAHGHPTAIRVGGRSEEPGVVPVSLASALNSLPAPLMALLAALLASAVALGGTSLRRLPRIPSLPIRLPRGK